MAHESQDSIFPRCIGVFIRGFIESFFGIFVESELFGRKMLVDAWRQYDETMLENIVPFFFCLVKICYGRLNIVSSLVRCKHQTRKTEAKNKTKQNNWKTTDCYIGYDITSTGDFWLPVSNIIFTSFFCTPLTRTRLHPFDSSFLFSFLSLATLLVHHSLPEKLNNGFRHIAICKFLCRTLTIAAKLTSYS